MFIASKGLFISLQRSDMFPSMQIHMALLTERNLFSGPDYKHAAPTEQRPRGSTNYPSDKQSTTSSNRGRR